MPRVFIYNPTCEMANRSHSVSYQPPAQLAQFEHDVASLLMFIAGGNDFVVAGEPDNQLKTFWRERGLPMPNFCSMNDAVRLIASGYELTPWGESRQLFHNLHLTERQHAFDNERRKLFSRLSSVALETEIAAQPLPDFARVDSLSRIITDEAELNSLPAEEPFVLKNLWSASGRGVVLVRDRRHVEQALVRARGAIRHDGAVIYEEFLHRMAEFSFLYWKHANNEVEYLGKNAFQTDAAGRFGAEIIDNECFTDRIRRWNIPQDWEQKVVPLIVDAIRKCSAIESYVGPIGLDAMFYEKAGKIRLRCCTEANLRLSMGNVNLGVARYFARGSIGEWKIERFKSPEEWEIFCRMQEREQPTTFDANGLITSGFFRLTSIGNGECYGAFGYARKV